MRSGLSGAAARPLGVCPAPRSRMVFHAFPGGGLVEIWFVRRCCQAPKSVPCAYVCIGFAKWHVRGRRMEAGGGEGEEEEEKKEEAAAVLYSKRLPNQGGLVTKSIRKPHLPCPNPRACAVKKGRCARHSHAYYSITCP